MLELQNTSIRALKNSSFLILFFLFFDQGDLTSEMFIVDTGKVQLTRVITAASSAKRHFTDAVKKLKAIKLLSSLSPSSHSASDTSPPPNFLRRRSSLDVVGSALGSVKEGLKSQAKMLGRGFSNVSADEDLDNESISPASSFSETPNNTTHGSFDSLAPPLDLMPQSKTPEKTPQEKASGSMPQDGAKFPSKNEAESASKMPSSRSVRHSELELKHIHSDVTKNSEISSTATTHSTGNESHPENGSQDGHSPPLVLGLGPGDFFGEAAVLGQNQSTSALSTEYSTFQVIISVLIST